MLRLHRKPPKKLMKKHLLRKTHLAAAKEEQARKRKQENELKKVEKRIEELETRDKEIDDTLVLPDVCTNVGRCAELSREKTRFRQNLKNYMKNGRNLRNCNFLSQYYRSHCIAVDTMALLCVYYNIFSRDSLIARMKSRLFSTVGFSIVVISARSLVILPLSIVERVAFSSLSANSSSF